MVYAPADIILNKLTFTVPCIQSGQYFLQQYLPVQQHISLKGRYAYEHHVVLSDNDGYVLGEACWGGNGGDFHIRLNEDGCEYLQQNITLPKLHAVLLRLSVIRLNRIELYVNDFIGAFSCQHAVAASYDDAFYRGMGPKLRAQYCCIEDMHCRVQEEFVTVGSTQSFISWRISNEAIYHQIPVLWNRSMAIINDIDIGMLLNIAGSFAGICRYASSMLDVQPDNTYLKHKTY